MTVSATSTPVEYRNPPVLTWHLIAQVLRERWVVAFVLPVLALLAGFAVSFMFEPRFRAESVLLPQESDGQQGLLASISGQFGGLAALAGLDLGSTTNKQEAIAILSSRSLAEKFIEDRQLLPVLFADDWDADSGRWKSEDPGKVPTMADAVREFDQNVRAVSEDRRTGVVTLTITWRDPVTSADWANELVARANQRMRASAIEEARSTIDFLSKRAESEDSVSVREALFSAVETQYKSMALASARPDFAFRVIDAATAPDPDDVAFPNRLLFAAAGALLGLLAAGISIAIAIQGHLSRAGTARARS